MQGQMSTLDRTDGDIDMLSARLARVRTLAYIANRADWLADPQGWQGRARDLEDRLSDTLHQSLMQRFVDRRTSTLLRSLHQHAGPVLGGIGADGAVTVEGHVVGGSTASISSPSTAPTALENRALRGAVERAVAPEIARRLGELASEADEAFALQAGGLVAWRGLAAGEIVGGGLFKPRVRLIGEFGADAARERAARRLEAFVAAEASQRLAALKRLIEAIADGRLRGLARGVAYQLVEQSGVLDRARAEEHIRALSQQRTAGLEEFRRPLRRLLALPAGAADARGAGDRRRLRRTRRTALAPLRGWARALPHPGPPPEALSLRGLRAVAGMAAPVLALERLDTLSRVAGDRKGRIELTPATARGARLETGPGRADSAGARLVRVRKTEPAEASLWRRRLVAPRAPAPRVRPGRRHRRRAAREELRIGPADAAPAARAAPPPRPPRLSEDRRYLPRRRLVVAGAVLQDPKPRRAHHRTGRRAPVAPRRADPARQGEPLGSLRGRADLRPRPPMASS